MTQFQPAKPSLHGIDDILSTTVSYWTKHGFSQGLRVAAEEAAPDTTAAVSSFLQQREQEQQRQERDEQLRRIAWAAIALTVTFTAVRAWRRT